VRSRDRIAVAAVAVALGFAGVAFGGATRWAACLAALLAVGSALPHLTSRRTASRLSPLVVLVLIAVVGTALQLVPLPMAIAEIVAAEKLALVRDHARALGETPPIWTVASHDPPATLVELAKLIGYLGLAWGATRIAAQRRARPWLAAAVVGAAALIALVTLAHRLVGATAVYGSFTMPERGGAPGPIINPNHLASLTALAAPLAFALGLHWRGRLRAAALLAALMLAATAFLTGSRGGAVGLLAGAVVTGIVLVAQRRAGVVDDDRRAPVAITIPAAIVAACAVALLGTVAARDVVHQVGSTELTELSERGSKYQVWGQAAPMIAEHRWLGVGRGSFEPAFTRRSPIAELTYSHVENSYLQAAVDWGVPIALALALAVLALGRAALRRWRHGPLEAGALGALTAVAVHELADFSLELPVVAMATLRPPRCWPPAASAPAKIATPRCPARCCCAASRRWSSPSRSSGWPRCRSAGPPPSSAPPSRRPPATVRSRPPSGSSTAIPPTPWPPVIWPRRCGPVAIPGLRRSSAAPCICARPTAAFISWPPACSRPRSVRARPRSSTPWRWPAPGTSPRSSTSS
jgi:hypothetical protein